MKPFNRAEVEAKVRRLCFEDIQHDKLEQDYYSRHHAESLDAIFPDDNAEYARLFPKWDTEEYRQLPSSQLNTMMNDIGSLLDDDKRCCLNCTSIGCQKLKYLQGRHWVCSGWTPDTFGLHNGVKFIRAVWNAEPVKKPSEGELLMSRVNAQMDKFNELVNYVRSLEKEVGKARIKPVPQDILDKAQADADENHRQHELWDSCIESEEVELDWGPLGKVKVYKMHFNEDKYAELGGRCPILNIASDFGLARPHDDPSDTSTVPNVKS